MPDPPTPKPAPGSSPRLARVRPGSSPRIPVVRPSSSPRHPRVDSGFHKRPEDPESKKVIIIAASLVGGALLLLLILVLATSGSSGPGPTPPSPSPSTKGPVDSGHTTLPKPVPKPKPKPKPKPDTTVPEVILALEQFARKTNNSEAILNRCQIARQQLKKSQWLYRIEKIEVIARAAVQNEKVDQLLADARKIIDKDPYFSRKEEVIQIYADAANRPGARKFEIKKLLTTYRANMEAARKKARASMKGPTRLGRGGEITDWLVIGRFKNPKDDLFTDFLKTEQAHVPRLGGMVTWQGKQAKWGPVSVKNGEVDLNKIPHWPPVTGNNNKKVISYGACWIECSRPGNYLIEIGSDDGHRFWLRGESWGREHEHQKLRKQGKRHPVELISGMNPLLIKVENWSSTYGFRVRVLTSNGAPAPGVRTYR